MIEQYNLDDINFKKAAIYKIVVKGEISGDMSERLWGLQLSENWSENNKSISSLVGQIRDQAALTGILNTIYDMHLTVISVNMLTEFENHLKNKT